MAKDGNELEFIVMEAKGLFCDSEVTNFVSYF